MSAYKFILGFIMVIASIIFLWIPANEVLTTITGVMNDAVSGNVAAIARNNMYFQIFYYSVFFMLMMFGIYILKESSSKGGDENEYV